jgi:hypothetical protein
MSSSALLNGFLQKLGTGGLGDLPALLSSVGSMYSPQLHDVDGRGLVQQVHQTLLQNVSLTPTDRVKYYSLVARAFRKVLVDHARAAVADGRSVQVAALQLPNEFLMIDDALTKLERSNPQAALITELRCFAGFDEDEIADILGLSPRTVKRSWSFARVSMVREVSMDASFHEEWTMRSFLLGQLDRSETEQIEGRILTDPDYCQQMQATEEDLIDDYLQGELMNAERSQFESRYLVSGANRRELQLAEALRKAIRSVKGTP